MTFGHFAVSVKSVSHSQEVVPPPTSQSLRPILPDLDRATVGWGMGATMRAENLGATRRSSRLVDQAPPVDIPVRQVNNKLSSSSQTHSLYVYRDSTGAVGFESSTAAENVLSIQEINPQEKTNKLWFPPHTRRAHPSPVCTEYEDSS